MIIPNITLILIIPKSTIFFNKRITSSKIYKMTENRTCRNLVGIVSGKNKVIIFCFQTLNELSGEGRHSGVMMWAGEQYEYRNVTPTFSQEYNETMPWNDRIDMTMEWLTHKSTPINLLYMYFEQPDSDSHKYGVNSKNVTKQLKRVDVTIEYFLRQLSKHDLMEKTNLIILSDHGMVDIDYDKMIDLRKILDPGSYTMCGGSPVLQLQLTQGTNYRIF